MRTVLLETWGRVRRRSGGNGIRKGKRSEPQGGDVPVYRRALIESDSELTIKSTQNRQESVIVLDDFVKGTRFKADGGADWPVSCRVTAA